MIRIGARAPRTAPVLRVTAAAVAALCVSGCAGGSATPAVHARDRVASDVHVTLNRYGVPVQTGVIGCEGPAPDGAIYCQATTAYEPQAEVDARFSAPAGVGASSCPGTLRITVDGAPLAKVAEDPCT